MTLTLRHIETGRQAKKSQDTETVKDESFTFDLELSKFASSSTH